MYLSVGGDEEQFFAVAAPARLLTAGNRNGPFALTRRKRPYVNFAAAGAVRREGHPMAVRRELAKQFVELGFQKWDGLAVRRGTPVGRTQRSSFVF